MQALAAAAEGQRLVELLRIFAFGTYSDYKARRAELPDLTPAQKRKLQLLTVVSLATKDKLIKRPPGPRGQMKYWGCPEETGSQAQGTLWRASRRRGSALVPEPVGEIPIRDPCGLKRFLLSSESH